MGVSLENMDDPILAGMTDTEIDKYVEKICPDNISEACLQIRLYCEHIQRIARSRSDFSPDARIMIENLAKLSKAIADLELISTLEMNCV
jgi:hypothetical protein